MNLFDSSIFFQNVYTQENKMVASEYLVGLGLKPDAQGIFQSEIPY